MGLFDLGPSNDGSIFRTQANTGFNSFQNPMPTLNMGGPGWGVDQSYLTPSYAAPYRPGQREAPITSSRPGFWNSANNIFNPLAPPPPKWADPFAYNQQFHEQFIPRGMDAAAWTAQNVGFGAAAFAMSVPIAHVLNYGSASAAASTSWMSSRTAIMGGNLMGGGARGVMGAGLAASNTGSLISAGATLGGRVAGGLFGGMVLPMAIGQGIVNAGDAAVFDPYANQRAIGRDLRENFSGVTFQGGNYGAPHTGQGLSFAASNRIAAGINKEGFKNWSFSGKEINQIADLSSRAGLMDNVNPDQFVKQISSITKQVAIIAAVANDPDFRNSIEIMAKLKDAGLNVGKAGSFMSGIGGQASIAGISTKRMLEIGTQAQFLFGANNLTPYLGQSANAQSIASFAAAKRNGLISDQLLARMGGVEGAAQSSITGLVNQAQTPYNQMLLANQYLMGKGGTSGNMAGNLSTFGQGFAGDPIAMMGAMSLYGGRMASKHLESKGLLGFQDQLMDMAKSMPWLLNADGTLDIDKAHALAVNSQMVGNKESEAMLMELRAGRDPRQLQNKIAGINTNYKKTRATLLERGGAAVPEFMLPITKGLRDIGTDLMTGYAPLYTVPMELASETSDYWKRFIAKTMYGEEPTKWEKMAGVDKTTGLANMDQLQTNAELRTTQGNMNDVTKTYSDYTEAIARAGTLSEFMIAMDNERDGKDTPLVRKFKAALGGASLQGLRPQLEAMQRQAEAMEVPDENGDGNGRTRKFTPGYRAVQEMMDYNKSKGIKKHFSEYVRDTGVALDIKAMSGVDKRISMSSQDTALQILDAEKSRNDQIKDAVKLYKEGKISASQFETSLNVHASERNLEAAELQIQAAKAQLQAAGMNPATVIAASAAPTPTSTSSVNPRGAGGGVNP